MTTKTTYHAYWVDETECATTLAGPATKADWDRFQARDLPISWGRMPEDQVIIVRRQHTS